MEPNAAVVGGYKPEQETPPPVVDDPRVPSAVVSGAYKPQQEAPLPEMDDPKEPSAAVVGGYNPKQEAPPTPPRLSCTKCFDALWFCYSPFYQMQRYYRYGEFDNCFGKWNSLVDCLSLKTKRSSEVQEILKEREKVKAQAHIWTYRTVEEASVNWWNMHSHFFKPETSKPDP